jgi:hypothetical protein
MNSSGTSRLLVEFLACVCILRAFLSLAIVDVVSSVTYFTGHVRVITLSDGLLSKSKIFVNRHMKKQLHINERSL